MIRIITSLFVYLMLFFSSILQAQVVKKVPCSGEKYQQFDFWVGDWNVYDTSNKLIGTNKLVKMQNNCVLQENWVAENSPSKGTSYNYYNKSDDSWNQVWIDNAGGSLVLKGKLIDGKMILKSDLIISKKGNYYNRITWSKNKDNSVTQVWETLNKEGQLISEAFRGIYKKKTK